MSAFVVSRHARTRRIGATLGSLVLACLISASAALGAEPAGLETKARQALIVDGETGAVLFEKDADTRFPPASLAKLMSMEVVFEAIEAGRLSPTQEFTVSEHAWRTGGAPSGTSTMFAKLNSSVAVEALIRGTIVQAANDAAIILAEGMAGSEEAFAGLMNETAARLGLSRSTFVNPTGLPAEGQAVTARDLVRLARHIRSTHTQFYGIYAEPSFEWNKIFQRNRNPLLPMNIGATGMGTGYTEASGYSIVGVTEREGRTTIIVLGGLESIKDRTEEARRLLDWSNTSFRRRELFAAGVRVGSATVFGGGQAEVSLLTRTPLVAYVPQDHPERVSARVRYAGPLLAPVVAGAEVGQIEVLIDGRVSIAQPLFAAESVEQGTFAARALDAAQELAFGWIRSL
ncbi:D-alanyl-D-alanine carboxypeptidase [Aureimonas sp. SA4125]|uniref:D-alanyl-D-alanine carboxypeptidase family protein n=1 Tax=Aureimonas sp. SA4125 TaxID=2826993 RepID=UPI001CC466F9|nr:D-alanyl-D-alanine carboxypeptidase family protein [Aureimonas sp. SA4125]BDA84628.1 D-alanyl-D-alanine carboxypeptidase [Aureimonas sp. SA4125]